MLVELFIIYKPKGAGVEAVSNLQGFYLVSKEYDLMRQVYTQIASKEKENLSGTDMLRLAEVARDRYIILQIFQIPKVFEVLR